MICAYCWSGKPGKKSFNLLCNILLALPEYKEAKASDQTENTIAMALYEIDLQNAAVSIPRHDRVSIRFGNVG
jgi:anionic cell wall polymer biosynthesis LytR-Cps2A-Psr (LCP) family protein